MTMCTVTVMAPTWNADLFSSSDSGSTLMAYLRFGHAILRNISYKKRMLQEDILIKVLGGLGGFSCL